MHITEIHKISKQTGTCAVRGFQKPVSTFAESSTQQIESVPNKNILINSRLQQRMSKEKPIGIEIRCIK